MSLITYKTIAAILIFLVSLASVVYPLRQKSSHHGEAAQLGEALASGIFLGAALFHMLPDAITLFQQAYGSLIYPIPEAICASGFLLLLFLERLSLFTSKIQAKNSIPYILALILIIHALTEGAALGIGYTYSETLLIFIAILAHKGSESFALCITMLRHQLPMRNIIFVIFLFSLMTPLGIFLGAGISELALKGHQGELIAAFFNAFAAGTFLYISTLHHIHFHQHERDAQGMVEFLFLLLGTTSMGVIALWT